MYNLFAEDKQSIGQSINTVKIKKMPADFKGSEEIKIGALVRSSFERLIADDLLTELEVERLQRLDYSKKTFNLNYPFMKKVDYTVDISDQKKVNGAPRFYTNTYLIRGIEYLLCNDWYEKSSRSYFDAWLRRIDEIN